MDPRDQARLGVIAEHTRVAMAYASRRGPEWTSIDETLDAVLMRIAQIGEEAKRLSPEAQVAVKGIDWRAVKGMRQKVVHDYGQVNRGIVRQVVEEELPRLLTALERGPTPER
jgi:uncharacterized protein with HEPN domain